MNCPKCEHVRTGCDEDCRGCPDCYLKTGDTICDRICPHAEHVDDGGFLIDGNHPDDMYGTGEL